jgi:hypothetical protein
VRGCNSWWPFFCPFASRPLLDPQFFVCHFIGSPCKGESLGKDVVFICSPPHFEECSPGLGLIVNSKMYF